MNRGFHWRCTGASSRWSHRQQEAAAEVLGGRLHQIQRNIRHLCNAREPRRVLEDILVAQPVPESDGPAEMNQGHMPGFKPARGASRLITMRTFHEHTISHAAGFGQIISLMVIFSCLGAVSGTTKYG